ncbi:phage tail protein [Salmonella enterica subsp. enterica]|uniref:phage tail-collar fiber domain-containing protein n=1 Tax=Salmonella enterica TaxID=28901 RepID=UPI001B83EB06|nr:phage tail protein [Salmonella enterica]EHJ5566914.1 phage tail protein [Salmonella enterica subsp. enterica serovar Kentucky]MBR7707290.1 phage tail protein [Salmonella enterica]MCL9054765.1 phage tail protein [Salmonella enterica subsp. enterica serovar Enteritidis]MDB6199711.1 phage tail protein [Salmonella enterica subsp. enterica]
MSKKFKTIITTAGAEKLAAATVPGGKKVNLTAMAVGDGGGTLPEPDAGQTKLINEVWRHALNKISQDNKNKNYIVAELVIPPDVGGFWMRELGLYDDAGTLIAVANMAESYKPKLAEGSGRAQTCRMVIIVSSVDSVALSIDATTVMATQDYVDDKLAEHERSRKHPDATLNEKGFTQLSSATDSTSESLAATPKAVKAAYDLADGKYTAQDASTAQKGIVQLSSSTDSNDEGKAATPKAVKAAYDLANGKYTAQDASTTQKGIVQLSSATDSNDEGKAATPKAVKAANDNAERRLAKEQNGRDIPNKPLFVKNIGLQDTVDKAESAVQRTGDTMSGKLNLPQTSSFGVNTDNALGGNSIALGDNDTGFKQESDGVIGVYANSQKVAEITNTEFKIIGNASLVNGALLLGGLTHFLRHTAADDAGFAGNNVELASWNGIGLTCTYDHITRIYFNPRTGEIGLRGDLKADGNVRSGNAWLDQTGNLQGSTWGAGVGLKAYLDNTFNRKNTASLDTNGWHRDESTGLITQWGLIDQANGTYNFPRAFPNQCFVVLVTNTNAQGSGVDNAFGYPISNSQFVAGSKNNGGGIGPYPVAFKALGR